jgi:hypothetical protein
MTTQPIIESGMTFGPFPEGHCFYIERSATYQKVKDGVKMAEFLLLRFKDGHPPTVWVVEAKSSTPRPETQPNLDEFIDEIRKKLTNALSLGLAACLKRHEDADAELSEPFKALDLSVAGFRLVLVIKDHKKDWLPPLQEALSKALKSTVKTWALPATAVAVINDDLARSHGLILANAGDGA